MVRDGRLWNPQSFGKLRYIVPLLTIRLQWQLPEDPQPDLISDRPQLNRQFIKLIH